MTVIYIGPNIRGVVRHNQIFSHMPEKTVEKAMGIDPLAGCLFVEPKEARVKKKEAATRGTLLQIVYQRMEKKEERNGAV
jgi:hypothetical protein